jgi:hypothetical protein
MLEINTAPGQSAGYSAEAGSFNEQQYFKRIL